MTEKIIVLGVGVLECTFMTGSSPSHMWFLGLSDEELIESALETVIDAIGSKETLVNDLFIRGVVKKWGSDPNTLGAFAEPLKGQVI